MEKRRNKRSGKEKREKEDDERVNKVLVKGMRSI